MRRAGALQQTTDAKIAKGVHINSQVAAQLSLNDGSQVQVTQNGTNVTLPVVIDERVPDEGV